VRSTLSVLAAALVRAASTGCSEDKDAAGEAGATTAAPATTAAAPATTTEPSTDTRPAATTARTTTGKSGTSGGRPEPPADQSRWAAQVDDACKPWQKKLDAVPPPTDITSLENWLAKSLPLVRKQVAAVKAVKLPATPSELRTAALFVSSLQNIERALTRYLAAIRADDAAAVQAALLQANTAGAQARNYASTLEVTECGGYKGG
jgi:hypothetical protein